MDKAKEIALGVISVYQHLGANNLNLVVELIESQQREIDRLRDLLVNARNTIDDLHLIEEELTDRLIAANLNSTTARGE